MPEPAIQRQVEPEEVEEEILQTKPLADQITPLVQRQAEPEAEPEEEEEEELLQTKPVQEQNTEVAPDLHSRIKGLQGDGQPLAKSERRFFEPRFGTDFSQVRLHTGSRASESARAIRARAFTTGRDIFFGSEEYAPGTNKGQRLLAHELTHVIQQQSSLIKLVQCEFEDDFEGRDSVRVTAGARPSRHVRVETPQGNVYAPYQVYAPSEVPARYQSLSMPSSQASDYQPARGSSSVPSDYVSVGLLARYAASGPPGTEVLVLIARVNGQYRLVGFHSSLQAEGQSSQGWVEGSPGVSGVGTILTANRINRSIRSGTGTVVSEVGFGDNVEAFHARILRDAGREGLPPDTYSYTLTLRQMMRVLASSDESLSSSQRESLRRLADSRTVPTVQQAAAILRGPSSGPGSGSGGSLPPAPVPPTSPAPSSGAPSGTGGRTGRYVIYQGQWHEIVDPQARGENIVRLNFGGTRTAPIRAIPITTGPTVARGPMVRGLGLLGVFTVIAGEVLVAGGRVLGSQRQNIERGQQEIRFWDSVGAAPTTGLWEPGEQRQAPPGALARASVDLSDFWSLSTWFGTHYLPYVEDINVDALNSTFSSRVRTYQEFAMFLEYGKRLAIVEEQNGRYFAIVNWIPRQTRRHEITGVVESTRTRVLGVASTRLRTELAALPVEQRSGGLIVRIPRTATIFRSAQGNTPVILNSAENFGSNPLVRIVDRREGDARTWFLHGFYNDRLRVVPVNADAYRAASYARYRVRGSLEEVWRRVSASSRSVTPSTIPSGRFESFEAGPDTGSSARFGRTIYTKDPRVSASWTVAVGELRSFWVSAADVTPVSDREAAALVDQA